MSPETIITQLEQINSWRRGEESEPQPDPKHVGDVIDAAVASLRSLIASNTTLRRERGDASALLATSKAGNASLVENVRQLCAELGQSHALRARVAELVEQLKAYGKYAHDTTQEDINSELVAALERVRDTPGSDQTAPYRLREIARDALARAESATQAVVQDSLTTEATPSKHPDTVRLDWLEQNEAVVMVDRRLLRSVEVVTEKIDAVCADTIRAAIAAARKQGGVT